MVPFSLSFVIFQQIHRFTLHIMLLILLNHENVNIVATLLKLCEIVNKFKVMYKTE